MVYGDIGTSPLYALKECFSGAHSIPPYPSRTCSGVLSLIFWSLNFVVTFKYITMVMRADNRGEGGILALLALVRPSGKTARAAGVLITTGLFGAALLYGDGIITPAISVLGAVEGLERGHAGARAPASCPIAFVIILALFFFQRRGTAGVGRSLRARSRRSGSSASPLLGVIGHQPRARRCCGHSIPGYAVRFLRCARA